MRVPPQLVFMSPTGTPRACKVRVPSRCEWARENGFVIQHRLSAWCILELGLGLGLGLGLRPGGY